MNTAEQLMAVKGLIWGLQRAEAVLKERVLEMKAQLGATSYATALGPVSVAVPKPRPVIVDAQAFLAWVEANRPNEIVRQVRESYTGAFLGQLVIDGGEVFTRDGELVEFAGVEQKTEYVSAALSAPVKAASEAQVAVALDGLLGILQIEAS